MLSSMLARHHLPCRRRGSTCLPHTQQQQQQSWRVCATSTCSTRNGSGSSTQSTSCISSDRTTQGLLQLLLDQHLADLSNSSTQAFDSCVTSEQRLEDMYKVLDEEVFFSKGGYAIPQWERAQIDATGGDATYGEVQASGVDLLLRCVGQLHVPLLPKLHAYGQNL
eukprot:GHRQ01014833.1.p1 GENE.GHRQ01014833.1~~GHRQ01014833.1.p1  ORF type:complete len:166 (+),score=40.11 GHRQ01014833.1:190-687(+)